MDYEEFIKYFTHEISYNLKMLGVTWRASPVIGEGKEGAMAVIRGLSLIHISEPTRP